jgi:hypothetical protein
MVGCMKKEDFMRLENQTFAWNYLTWNAKLKAESMNKRISMKKQVFSRIGKK